MSLQKLSASLLATAQETNLGLATLNLDFSLIKVEAPTEFQAIGNELSRSRKIAAEEGKHHVTARKLGILFQHSLPHVPDLIKAYGKRATAIMECPDSNPKPTAADGIFADQVGLDATSLWAAATSGGAAIAVHLLSCLLARVWSSSEATAIWVELVEGRRHELAKTDETHPLYQEHLHLSKVEITRDQLSTWDASARSWLRAADKVMARKHKQLELIINNVSLPVVTKASLYQSVLHSWKRTMELINDLIIGKPQSVEDGSLLVGLSSWHIYPDMVVLTGTPISVNQNDPLVSSAGILTIGLQIERESLPKGVFWSLPLGHLRYYGGPVQSERTLDMTRNRATVMDLLLVAIGCLTKTWRYATHDLADIMVRIRDYVSAESQYIHDGTVYWLGLLAQALEPVLADDKFTDQQCEQLLRFGAKRAKSFLCPELTINPLFGLCDVETLLLMIDDIEEQVNALRLYAETLEDSTKTYIIRYKAGRRQKHDGGYDECFGYATAKALERHGLKRDHNGAQLTEKRHIRWIVEGAMSSTLSRVAAVPAFHDKTTNVTLPSLPEAYVSQPMITQMQTLLKGSGEELYECNSDFIEDRLTSMGVVIRWSEPPDVFRSCLQDYKQEKKIYSKGEDVEVRRYTDITWIIGNTKSIALFATKAPGTNFIPRGGPKPPPLMSLDILRAALGKEAISRTVLLEYLSSCINHPSRADLKLSLRALATLTDIYKMLPGATVDLKVTSKTLHQMAWAKVPPKRSNSKDMIFRTLPLTRAQTFSCIVLFESGTFEIEPRGFKHVMALAAGDSIYISAALLCDPFETPAQYEVRRIKGNIGKPGMALLIPPQEPRKRDEEWKLAGQRPFDGRLENSFHTTSLHLWFTDYTLPIDTGSHGTRDFEIYFLESVVSIHDKGKWVADVDILKNVEKRELLRIPIDHNHLKSSACSESNELVINNPMFTSIDDWDEILELPDALGMVRSHKNWLGRLAAAALSSQLGHSPIVLPDEFCWRCFIKGWGSIDGDESDGDDLLATLSEESPSMVACAAIPVLFISAIAYIVYQRYFHPLAAYPGPFLASVTDLWQVSQFLGLKQPYNLTELHEKHGPFVRYGPDKLSITAEEVVPLVYQKGGRMMPKTEFYDAYGAAIPNVFGMRDEAAHSIRRRLMAHSFSISSVRGMEQYLDTNIRIMRRKIAKFAAQEQVFDLQKVLHYYTIDVLGELAFGQSFGAQLTNDEEEALVPPVVEHSWLAAVTGAWPSMTATLKRLLPWVPHAGLQELIKGRKECVELAAQCVQRSFDVLRQNTAADFEKSVDAKRKDILTSLIQAKDPETGEQLRQVDLETEAFGFIIAGTRTTSATTSLLFYHLLHAPEILAKCVAEVDQSLERLTASKLAYSMAEVESSLPYLKICIRENFRLTPVFTMPLARRVTAPEGITIAGRHIKQGTSVAVCNHAFHHNPDIWGASHNVFDPSRWDIPEINHRARYLMHFGLGGRQCIGKTIAQTNIYKVTSTLLSEFQFELANESERNAVRRGDFVGKLPELISVGISDLKNPIWVTAKSRSS